MTGKTRVRLRNGNVVTLWTGLAESLVRARFADPVPDDPEPEAEPTPKRGVRAKAKKPATKRVYRRRDMRAED